MKTREEFNEAVAKLALVEVKEVERMSLAAVAEEIILPRIAREGGSWNRCPRISDDYMDFMADFGGFIHYNLNDVVCMVLFEIGLQRISKGALWHCPVNLLDILPASYKMYSAAYDEPGVFSKGCWNFLKKNIAFLFNNIGGNVQVHMRKMVFGIMEHIDEEGNTKLNYDAKSAGVTPLELRKLVEDYATLWCSEQERWNYVMIARSDNAYRWVKKCNAGIMPYSELTEALAPCWSRNKAYFKEEWKNIDWKLFSKNVDFEKEQFYGGFVKKFLKAVGLYKIFTLSKIKKEIDAFNV